MAVEKAQRVLHQQRKQDDALRAHQLKVTKLNDEIEMTIQRRKDAHITAKQDAILAQKRLDLENAKKVSVETLKNKQQNGSIAASAGKPTNLPVPVPPGKPTAPQEKQNSLKSLRKHVNSAPQGQSPSSTEWQRQKNYENAHNQAIDEIMGMIGLEDVKSQVLKIKAKVETGIRQGTDLKKERLGLVLLGNPGTGKTTVARHYANVLMSLNVLSGSGFVETTGSRLAHGGVKEVKDHLNQLNQVNGGVYFIDEAYQLAEDHNHGGKTVLDFLLAEIENLMGEVVFVFAGYTKQMEKFFEHNPGFASRIPHKLIFEDYTDPELLLMLQSKMSQFYQPDLKIDDGLDGLYINIAIRRLGRGRSREGFGNARDLENVFQKIRDRQATRLQRERTQGLKPDDFYFTKEDLIGPDPSEAIQSCAAWTQLQNLIGLQTVKDSVRAMVEMISTNYQRELKNKSLVSTTLNRVFLGSPGTGKTTVAKLYGQILAHIGVLSNGEGTYCNLS